MYAQRATELQLLQQRKPQVQRSLKHKLEVARAHQQEQQQHSAANLQEALAKSSAYAAAAASPADAQIIEPRGASTASSSGLNLGTCVATPSTRQLDPLALTAGHGEWQLAFQATPDTPKSPVSPPPPTGKAGASGPTATSIAAAAATKASTATIPPHRTVVRLQEGCSSAKVLIGKVSDPAPHHRQSCGPFVRSGFHKSSVNAEDRWMQAPHSTWSMEDGYGAWLVWILVTNHCWDVVQLDGLLW